VAYPFRLAKPLLWILIGPILFRGTAYPVDVSASPYGRVVKLPILDRHDLRFVPVTADGSALQSGIKSIAQDNFGFLWLGGHGLYRYDGYSLQAFRHEPGNPNSLSDDSILDVLKDRAGILWVGTAFGGLDRLDPTRGIVTHYRYEPGNERSLSNNSVTCLYQDRSGRLWIGTNGGLDRLDPATATFTHYRHNSQDADSLSSNDITSLLEDRRGNWIAPPAALRTSCPIGLTPGASATTM
jgi:ligand-binding sensor domain-containing protein